MEMRLRIVSDGTPLGTKVVNLETGETVDGVSMIDWHIETGELAKATIRIHDVDVEIGADGKVSSTDLPSLEMDRLLAVELMKRRTTTAGGIPRGSWPPAPPPPPTTPPPGAPEDSP